MSIEDEIQRLLKEALPLRSLEDDDPAKSPLPGIVDAINKLRAEQSREPVEVPAATIEGADAQEPAEPMKRGPGRPKKAE